ncbi:uncharacterized protein VTP21DRAFT_8913 [Calcarisporiella thermophila]|uniref:uncharacterized protein n=1 Tax=Calcarisporiella thermophila TaxID=911321 RepID=UPI0037444B5A
MSVDAVKERLKLTDKLHKGTQEHQSQFSRLLSTKLPLAFSDPRIYRQTLRDFYFLFKTVEEEYRRHMPRCEVLQHVWIENLMNRTEPFERDLAVYYGRHWRRRISLTRVMLEYTSHVRQVAAASPELLLAYVFTLYGTLLSSGHIICERLRECNFFPRRVASRTHPHSSSIGTEAFTVQNAAELRSELMARLDSLGLEEPVEDAVLSEAMEIYKWNIRVIGEIHRPQGILRTMLWFGVVLAVLSVALKLLVILRVK